MSDELRLFVAIELPAPILEALQTLQNRLKAADTGHTVRWVQPTGIHLTLKFLGEVPAGRRMDITRAMEAAVDGHAPLTLSAAGLGCFPNTRRPRVVWAGLAGDLAPLADLQRSVERALVPLGFPPEDRAFSPHLTLGRVRREASAGQAQALGDLIARQAAEMGAVPLASWSAGVVSLMRSELDRGGARYTCLAEAPLLG